ncbi:MAG: 4-(cytidine 5'-diphospho)-2-C-methyl-D-erythritol kinase [Chlamydiae bacterium]|nr:4-(cytidine 5'-diphospho)-2-C-methyl-D-erythritol kinase [Chlamydiota bacterium]
MRSKEPFIDPKGEHNSSSFDLILSSPAKVNLFFRVLFKRLDGFHEIASLYQAISLFDTICIRKSAIHSITSTDPSLNHDPSNLVCKAADLFFQKTGFFSPVHIHLIKRIPMQAGLGGGSGNAATVLWGLNALFGSKVDEKDLSSWSSALGCDVPFFFSPGTAYCTGKGEVFIKEALPSIEGEVTIIKPSENLPTPLVYRHCNPQDFIQRDPQISLKTFSIEQGPFYNDLEIPACSLLPSLQRLKDRLIAAGFSHVLLSGSGTAFFCLGIPHTFSFADCLVKKVRFIQRTHTGWYE